jgi:type I restriction enzyme S subunit
MSFPQYPEYKDSGVEWLGEVPAHWEKLKLSRISREKCDGPFGSAIKSEHYRDSGVRVIRLQNIKKNSFNGRDAAYIDANYYYREISRSDVVGGDLLVAGLGDDNNVVGRACVAPYSVAPAMVKADCFRFRLDDARVLPGFLAYQLSAGAEADAGLLSTGSTRSRIPLSAMGTRVVALPPRDEQAKVSAFLDHETARIDALVEQQQRLIELLKEKRQAVISHAVTKGLEPGVPMKESGVEWLGKVPAHWGITRVKHIVRTVEQGWSPQCENSPVESESEWGVLKVGCVNHGRFVSQENKKLPADLSPRLDLSIKADDVLISRANTRELVGSCAVPTVSYPNLMLSDKLFRLRLRETVADPRFFAFFMGAPQTRQQIELEATGASSSMLNIGQSTVLEMPFPCPPLEEQAKIRDEIIKQTWSLLDLAGQALQLQKSLEERRSALISAAVTGKIDVRGWQPPAGSSAPSEVAQTEAV